MLRKAHATWMFALCLVSTSCLDDTVYPPRGPEDEPAAAGEGTDGDDPAGDLGDDEQGSGSGGDAASLCEPTAEDDTCTACLKTNCCSELEACFSDSACGSFYTCMQELNDIGTCLGMNPDVDLTGPELANIGACSDSTCGGECQ